MIIFKMQWENYNVFLTDLKAVEMHQMQGNIFWAQWQSCIFCDSGTFWGKFLGAQSEIL